MSASGEEVLLGLRARGQLVGYTAAPGGLHSLSGTAATTSSLYCIPARQLRENPSAGALLVKHLSEELEGCLRDLIELKTCTAKERLRTLLGRLGGFPAGDRMPLSGREVAGLISVSPEYLSRLKKQVMVSACDGSRAGRW